ncbi:MAG: ATP-binding cassette domain-containing protein [Candidatus Lokiarchaeota archaeon]
MENITVDVNKLNVHFGKAHVINDVSFKVKKGELIGFFGISGAGKTTIIRVLTCQLSKKNWTGDVKVTGLDPAKSSNHSKILSRIGYIPQLELQNLYYELSALDNVETFANTYGMKKMSGGEKKRVSMAIGLIHEPEVLFLDEPTTQINYLN